MLNMMAAPCRIQVAPSVQRRKVSLTPATRVPCSNAVKTNKNSSGDEIANVNCFYNIAHVEASAYAH